MLKNIFRQIHLWLSVPFGLIVVIICLSGALLIFERDFGHIGQTEVASNGRSALPMDSILNSAQRYLADSNQIVGVTTYPDSEHAYKVMLAKPAMAAIWVNQYTGEVLGKYDRPAVFKRASRASLGGRKRDSLRKNSLFRPPRGPTGSGMTSIA